MTGKIQLSFIAALLGLSLSSCQAPETPRQVTEHFWQAVVDKKLDKIVEYSTLTDINDYQEISIDWSGYQADKGKTVIENNIASVESIFKNEAGSVKKERRLITFLILQNEKWKVDYTRTRDTMKPEKVEGLFDKLNQLGKQLSEQLENSTGDLNTELDKLGDKLQELSDQVGSEAKEGIEKFTDELEKSLEELEQSIDRALKKDREQQPEQGDESLQET